MSTAKELSEEQRKRLGSAALTIWNEIGGDYLRILEDSGEKAAVPRDEVIELIVDAGRLESELARKEGNKDIISFIKKADYNEIVKALTPFFPYKTYGW